MKPFDVSSKPFDFALNLLIIPRVAKPKGCKEGNENERLEVSRLEEKRKKLRREIYDREDEIDNKNERLQDEMRSKLEGASTLEPIMTISFEMV